jgi:hypothetical protein
MISKACLPGLFRLRLTVSLELALLAGLILAELVLLIAKLAALATPLGLLVVVLAVLLVPLAALLPTLAAVLTLLAVLVVTLVGHDILHLLRCERMPNAVQSASFRSSTMKDQANSEKANVCFVTRRRQSLGLGEICQDHALPLERR